MFNASESLSDEQIKSIFGRQNKVVNITLIINNKNIGFISWKGETENLYFFIHYICGVLYLSFDERELRCSYKDRLIYIASLKNTPKISDLSRFTHEEIINYNESIKNLLNDPDELFKKILKFLKWSKAKNLEINDMTTII